MVQEPTAGLDRPVLLGVAGAPDVVANSLSPTMFEAAFRARGMRGYYVPLAIRERSARKALRGLARLGFAGVNVTMPFKPVAAEVAHTRSELVEQTGIANTLKIRPDGQIHAEATDGLAFAAALEEAGTTLEGASVTLLGAGGAATEAAWAAAMGGAARIHLWNRSPERAGTLADRLQAGFPNLVLEVFDEVPIDVPSHVLVSAIPAAGLPPEALQAMDGGPALVVDFAYYGDRRPTPLIEVARSAGKRVVDGRELLVRQAAEAYRVWFADDPPVEEMARAVA